MLCNLSVFKGYDDNLFVDETKLPDVNCWTSSGMRSGARGLQPVSQELCQVDVENQLKLELFSQPSVNL